MSIKKREIKFGSYSSCYLIFDNENGVDTRVSIYSENTKEEAELCWISKDSIDSFCEDFEALLKKYFI